MAFFNSRLYGILSHKCPQCHQTKLFKSSAINLKHALKMHDSCQNCQQLFVLEPGFYWGAMYIAYGLSSLLLLGSFFLFYAIVGLSVNQSYIIMMSILVILYTSIYRLARSIWVNIFVPFNADKYGK